MKKLGIALLVVCFVLGVRAQDPGSNRRVVSPVPAGVSAATSTLITAADALGMLRNVNRVDAINRMEYWASGTSSLGGQLVKTEYHSSLSYDPPGMRIETTRTPANGATQHTIQVVNDKYAWDETEIGAGLPGAKGSATPNMAAFRERYLQLWTFPYGVIKAARTAGDKVQLSKEKGATVIAFPLSGQLEGTTVRATLDAKNLVTKVEIHSDNRPTAGEITEVEYSDYGDHGDDPSDVQFPGRIVQKQGDKVMMDIRIKMDDPNNPYAIFPPPDSVVNSVAH